MTGIKSIAHQGAHHNSLHLKVVRFHKRLTDIVPVKASLVSAILLWSGGAITVTAGANPVPTIIIETPQDNPAPSTATIQTPQANPASSNEIVQTPLGARVIYVNPAIGTDSGSAGTTELAPVRTITYALQQADAGTVVQLAPGTYAESTGEVFPLYLPEGVILRGDESSKGQRIIIIGGASYQSRVEANQNVTIRADQNSEISGVTISNPNIRGTGLWIESTNPTVRNNTFSNSLREGVLVTGTGTPKIEDNIFTKNQGNGISIGRLSKGEIRNNLFQGTGFGIALSEKASPLITDNRIIENVDGIVASSEAAPVLRNNVIETNKRDGVVAVSLAQPDLGTADTPGNNRIRNNGRYDINNSTTRNTLLAYGNDFDTGRTAGRLESDTPPVTSAFSDVRGHWAQAYIEALAAKNIIAGFKDGTFRPSEPVTRAQFAAIIKQAFTPAPERPASNFVDVSSKFWAYEPIQTAYRGGFVSGYPDKRFRPDQRIPKVQVLVSLASGLKLRSDNTSLLSVYSDRSLIPNYAIAAVAGATQRELVVNYPTPTTLEPNREATRAEVAAFVYQALVNAGRVEPIPSNYLVKNPQAAQR